MNSDLLASDMMLNIANLMDYLRDIGVFSGWLTTFNKLADLTDPFSFWTHWPLFYCLLSLGMKSQPEIACLLCVSEQEKIGFYCRPKTLDIISDRLLQTVLLRRRTFLLGVCRIVKYLGWLLSLSLSELVIRDFKSQFWSQRCIGHWWGHEIASHYFEKPSKPSDACSFWLFQLENWNGLFFFSLSVFQRPEPAGAEHDDRPGLHHSTEPRFWHRQPFAAPRVEPAFRQCQRRHQWGWARCFIKSSVGKCSALVCCRVVEEKQHEQFSAI